MTKLITNQPSNRYQAEGISGRRGSLRNDARYSDKHNNNLGLSRSTLYLKYSHFREGGFDEEIKVVAWVLLQVP